MPLDTQHPDYKPIKSLWETMTDAMSDESVVHLLAEKKKYLPKTAGMQKRENGQLMYEAFLQRARFPAITSAALTGVVGLLFEREPLGVSDEVVTKTGQANEAFARDSVRGVCSKGRDILVVDAPPKDVGGGDPYLCRYSAESLINWKTNDRQQLSLAVLLEETPLDEQEDDYSHDTESRYRVYQLVGGRCTLTVYANREGGPVVVEPERVVLTPDNIIPIRIPGSIDNLPAVDPIPLLPVARCAFAFFRKSALYEHGLYLTSQPTPYVKGLDDEQYEKIIAQGVGSSALWNLPEDGDAGFLEVTGNSLEALKEAMQDELNQAETYAVRLTQKTGSGVEAAEALRIRAASQHASVFSIAHSVSQSVTWAQSLRNRWAGSKEPIPFEIQTEFHGAEAAEQMITALSNAITALNAPRSTMFELLRRTQLTKKSDEEMEEEINNQGAGAAELFQSGKDTGAVDQGVESGSEAS